MSIIVNWKTSLTGIGALLVALGHLIGAISHGDTSTLMTDLPAIMAAIGLIFAKDSNVTGGTTPQ